jgi:AcrR family transcriptional regulator
MGLRERKKLETARAVRQAAIDLFLARGFDDVSVSEIADAANVSKMTVFNYFPAKEDLLFAPMEEHAEELAAVVRDRPAGETPLAALRRHHLDRLAARDPSVGLNDTPLVVGLQRIVMTTPSLMPRLRTFLVRGESALAEVLVKETDPLTARLAASQIMAARGVLLFALHEGVTAGHSADELYPEAVEAANRAYDLLERGLPL